MNTQPPFHSGELKVQQRANEADIGQRNGGVISNLIIPGAIPFIAQQNMVVLSSLDEKGLVWASVLVGDAGFIRAPDASTMLIDTQKIVSSNSDPFWKNIQTNPKVGVLAIELSTRRRLRVNGRIRAISDTQFEIVVEQAFPNCPKYIQRRSLNIAKDVTEANLARPLTGTKLRPNHIKLIQNADSFFVGSASPVLSDREDLESNQITKHGGDASHRGGLPGFIELKGQKLIIPDYKGNSMFNTLGNIELYPFAGIVLLDFERSKLLQLSGEAKILWDQDDPTEKSAGTKRFWQLEVKAWQETALPETINWQFYDYSPHNPREKNNQEKTIEDLKLEVKSIVTKSENIKKFRLTAEQGSILPAFEPGAHLPIEFSLPSGIVAQRHYSILNSSSDNRYYEIAVQRESKGRGGSNFIHSQFKVGTRIRAKAPSNEFPLLTNAQHTILLAGGIGITPILSMIHKLIETNSSFEVHYTAKTKKEAAFYDDVLKLAGDRAHFYFSKETDSHRIDLMELMKNALPQTHLYMCGPVRMINAVRAHGEELKWSAERIHFESFGASTSSNDKAIDIKLAKSNVVVKVKPTQTVLDALINAKVPVPFDCKRGECGMCATQVVKGKVEHRDVYLNSDEQKQQMCVCVSRAVTSELVLDL